MFRYLLPKLTNINSIASHSKACKLIRWYAKKAPNSSNKIGWEWSSEQMESNMDKVIQNLSSEYAQLQIGRATPALLSKIYVQTNTSKDRLPLESVAQISVQDPHTLLAIVPNSENTKQVESAIRAGNLNLNPVAVDKNTIKIPIPRPSKESRELAGKRVHAESETRKTSIRALRHSELKRIEKMNGSGISGADKRSLTQEVDKICKSFVEKCDSLAKLKIKEILK